MRLDKPIALLAVAETIVWAGLYYIFPALLVHWEADLGWSKTELTGAFTASIAMSALCSPIVGNLVDRGHGAAVLSGGTLIGGILIARLREARDYAYHAGGRVCRHRLLPERACAGRLC